MICEDKKTIGWFICSAKVSNGLTLVLLLLLKQLLYAKLAKVSKIIAYAIFSTLNKPSIYPNALPFSSIYITSNI